MRLLANIKRWLYRRSLRQRLAQVRRPHQGKGVNLQTARTVGIYFDATSVDERQTVLRFAQQLREQGKQVRLLGFFQHVLNEAEFSFDAFSVREIDWTGRPKSPKVEHFLGEPVDLFLALQPKTSPVLEYIACLIPAALRVGPVAEQAQAFDLMLDVPASADHRTLLQHFQRILKVTNVQPEPVTA